MLPAPLAEVKLCTRIPQGCGRARSSIVVALRQPRRSFAPQAKTQPGSHVSAYSTRYDPRIEKCPSHPSGTFCKGDLPSSVVVMSESGIDAVEQRPQNPESKSLTKHGVGSHESKDNVHSSQVKTRSKSTSKTGERQDPQEADHKEIEPDTKASPSSNAFPASRDNLSSPEGCGHLNSDMSELGCGRPVVSSKERSRHDRNVSVSSHGDESNKPPNRAVSVSIRSQAVALYRGCSPVEVEIESLTARVEHLKLENERLKSSKSSLEETLKKLRTSLNVAQREKHDMLHERNQVIVDKSQLKQQVQQIAGERDNLLDERHQLRRKVHAEETEVQRLQKQITAYKTGISASTRVVNQVADDIIKDKFDHLFFSMQDFVARWFRGAVFNYEKLPEETKKWMASYIPCAQQLPRSYWLSIVISIMSKILVDKSGPEFYFGSSDLPGFLAVGEMTVKLKPTAHAETKVWLETTRNLIAINDASTLQEADESLVQLMLIETEHTILKAMQIEWHSNVQRELATIYQSGLELSRLLHRQNAMFQVEMAPACHEGVPQHFHPVTMEDVNNIADEEALLGRTIDVSVFPLVYKNGDERGENLDMLTFVSRAKVVPMKKPRPLNRVRHVPSLRQDVRSKVVGRAPAGTHHNFF